MCSFAIHILSLKTSLSHLLPVVDKYNRRSMECIEWAAFYTLSLGHQASLWPWVKNIKYAVKTFPKWQIMHQKAPWGVLIKFVLYCFIADCYYNFHSSTKINRIRIFFTTPTLQIGPSVQISFEATAMCRRMPQSLWNITLDLTLTSALKERGEWHHLLVHRLNWYSTSYVMNGTVWKWATAFAGF